MDEGDDDETYRVGESLGLRDTGSNRNTKPEYNTDGSHELTVTVTAQPPPPKAEHRMTGNQQFIMSDGGESWKSYDQRHKDHEDMLPVGMQELLDVPTTSGANGEVGGTANPIQAGSIQMSPQQQYQLVSSVIWQGSNALIVQDGRLQVNGSENGGAMYTAIPVQAQAVPTSQPSATSIPNEKSKLKASRKKKTVSELKAEGFDPCKLEDNPAQVEERFGRGCECQEENCFRGLNADFVYRHRLNIAELSKAEHDMYLMGVTMACLQNPEETVRHKERKRLRAQYVFHGKKVCLDAFLYLENTTHYQVKRIRKHVMTHGVTARVHGNHGKKPHNTFSLDSYQHATAFLQTYIQRHLPPGRAPVTPKSKLKGKLSPIYLPSDITRKKIHAAYKEYCEHFEPAVKVMGYSTFRYFMKDQFPHVRFLRLEPTAKRDVDPGGKAKQNSNDVKADSNPIDASVPSDPVGTNSFVAQTNYVMAAVTAPAVTQNVASLTPATNVAPTLYTYTATPLTGHTYVLTPVPPAAAAPLHPPPPYSSCQIPEQTDPILEHLPPMRTTPPLRPPTPPTRTQDAQTWM